MTRIGRDVADRRVETVCLLILTFIAVGVALYLLKPVLVPFVLAVFFTYCLTPLIDVQARYLHVPAGVAIVGTAILGIVVLALLGFIVATAVGGMSQNLGAYEGQLHELTERAAGALPLKRLGIRPDAESGRFFTIPEDANRQFISAVLTETRNLLSNGALVVIFMIFILVGRKRRLARPVGVLSEIELRVKRYAISTLILSGLTGGLVGIALAVLGVEFAGVFGFLAFLLNFIPSLGAIIATLLPLPVILLSPELTPTAKVLAIAIPAAVQAAIGIVQPRIQGDALALHPVTVLLALVFFGMIWGIVGAFVATPIAAVIKIILERIEATRPVAAVLAGDLTVLAERPGASAEREPPA
jgi:AI-2 transport protein TqsA